MFFNNRRTYLFARICISLSDCLWFKKRWPSLTHCQNDSYREQFGKFGIRSLLQQGLWCLMSHLTFHCGLILWIPKEAEYIQLAFHNENCSSLCRMLTVESPGGGILIWSNCWASYPLLNA